jgi:hypothetical protein
MDIPYVGVLYVKNGLAGVKFDEDILEDTKVIKA